VIVPYLTYINNPFKVNFKLFITKFYINLFKYFNSMKNMLSADARKQPTKILIVGYGNVGRGVHRAIEANAKHYGDVELVGVVSRRLNVIAAELPNTPIYRLEDHAVIDADVAILCGGSKDDIRVHGPRFAIGGFNTVDSFDTHADIPAYFNEMDGLTKANERVAVISAGWDPGTFSLERVLGNAFVPGSKAYTFWGPGVSQGHTDAIKQIPGVAEAIQYTIPRQEALVAVRSGTNPDLTTRQKHKRDCHVALKPGADAETVRKAIVEMPKYFADYDTQVTFETINQVKERRKEMPHGGFVTTSGTTGKDSKATIEYQNAWGSNPEATGSILVACARAAHRLNKQGNTGAFTMLDIPAALLSPHSREELLKDWM
jgi:diaminopimelate dehydrogenase